MSAPQTLIDKLWSAHEIARRDDGAALLWVDRHYVHEGSFLAFSQMQKRGRSVAEPGLTFGIADHYVPTRGRGGAIADPAIAAMVTTLLGMSTPSFFLRVSFTSICVRMPKPSLLRASVTRASASSTDARTSCCSNPYARSTVAFSGMSAP